MKIAFCGDSFCADNKIGTWPYLVKEKLNAKSIWKGVQGANQYAILQDAKKILVLKPDLIVFTHTDPYRLANRHNRPLGARPCEQNKHLDKVWETGHLYYEHLMDYGFHELTHIALVNECNNMCVESKIKVLHLFSFSTNELDYRDYKWDVNLDNSYNEKSLARISYDFQTPDNDEYDFNEPGWKTLPNHMNYKGNKFVSEIVLKMLQ